MEIRLAARKALLEAADERAYREAINARPRVLRKFEAKDLVYVWRCGKASGFKAGHRGRWVGPSVVLGEESGNPWVAMNNQMIKAAPE